MGRMLGVLGELGVRLEGGSLDLVLEVLVFHLSSFRLAFFHPNIREEEGFI